MSCLCFEGLVLLLLLRSIAQQTMGLSLAHYFASVWRGILGFFYEPRGPVSYPAQFFFWEDLQNNYYLGPRGSPGFEPDMLASSA